MQVRGLRRCEDTTKENSNDINITMNKMQVLLSKETKPTNT